MSINVAVAISADINCAEVVFNKLDSMVKNLGDFEITSINDKNQILEKYAKARGKKVTAKSFNNRVGARQALANATHVIVFWSGHDLSEIIFVASINKLPLKISPFAITSVVNKDSGQLFDIYIGRGSPLGNPFPIEHGTDKDRAHVIERYREYFHEKILTDPSMAKYLESLRGLKLGCHCKPAACHGDIIAEYLNSTPSSND